MRIVPFILAGGQGNRLWPASRQGRPKQFLPLLGGNSLLRRTFDRVAPLADGGLLVVITVEGQEEHVAQCLPELAPERIWSEPVGRNTAPSIAWALREAARDHAGDVAAFFPADHMVRDDQALREAVRAAAAAAQAAGSIALLGVPPTRPETGYGYMEAGPAEDAGARPVTRFLEKPRLDAARDLLERDDVFWNSGIFVIPVGAGLAAVREASATLARFLDALPPPGGARRLEGPDRAALAAAFAAVPPCPFDVEVMERTMRRIMLPLANAGWSDLGSWAAIWEVGEPDASGNVLAGPARAVDAQGCLLASDGPAVAALGVRDLVIVAWSGGVLVCPRDRAQEVKSLVEKMP